MSADSKIPFAVAAGLACGVLFASACASAHRDVDAEAEIAHALDLPGAVVFHTDGGVLDAGEPAADVLTRREAVRRAVETSAELQAALARVRAAAAEAELAQALPNPVLSLVFRIPEGGGEADAEAGLGADLLAILQRPRRSSAAGHRLEGAAAAALSVALDVVAEVEQAYVDVQALEELAPVLDLRLAVLERLREVAAARADLGEATRRDVTALDAERLELELETAERHQELRAARLALARRIGAPSSATAWRLELRVSASDVSTEERAWIDSALRTRPEVLAIEWELRARGDELELAGGSSLDGATLGVNAERQDDWSVGPALALPIPLFDTGGARERRASALESETRHRLVGARRAVVEEVRTALAAWISARERLGRVVRELVPLQERRRAEVEEAFRLGSVDATAVLFAERELRETQSQRIGLEREVASTRVRLERSVGGRAVLATDARAQGGLQP